MTTLNVRTAAQLADLIPPFFIKTVRSDTGQYEFFNKLAGPEGSRSAILSNNSFMKEAGDTLGFTVESELFGAGKTGENTLKNYEEKAQSHRFGLPLTLYRHAEAFTKLGNKEVMVNNIVRAGGRLARWIAIKKDDVMFSEFLSPGSTNLDTVTNTYTTVTGPTPKTLYGGGVASVSALTTACRFSLDEVDKAKLAMVRMGAKPVEVRSQKNVNQVLPFYICIIDEMSAFRLFSSSEFREAVQAMLPRSFDHPLITGALGCWNGCLIHTFSSINQGCHQGTPLRPECSTEAGSTIYDNTAARTIVCVGADDGRDYTKNFPSSGKINVNVAGTLYELTYTSKGTYYFTLSHSITSVVGGGLSDGVMVTAEKDNATCIFLGAEAAVRAFAERDEAITEVDDYGMELGVGIEAIWGNRVIQDSSGNAPNYLLLKVMADSPNYQV